jgi:Secretion system C-terminal sorting domain
LAEKLANTKVITYIDYLKINQTKPYLLMNRTLFFKLAFTISLFHFNDSKGQPDHFAYAVTSVNKGDTSWVALRKLDTRTSEFSNILLHTPDSSIAAIAYDRKSNRLYYSPMNIDQLHYIDLSTMESFPVADQFFSKAGKYDARNAGPINRMVIAPDDYGYTITNDGTHLIRFTTNGSPTLTDMGDLIDDPQNKEMTIHSICANSGGDLVADDDGHLYLITGSNKVFKVDIATRMTSYLGTVSGLPQKFTTSGLAVSENGKQLIATSVGYTDAYFLINSETWNALPSQITRDVYESADLANSNVLFTNTNHSNLFITKSPENLHKIKIFPNPVMDDVVSIQFNELPSGNYTIQLADLLGNRVVQQNATIISAGQTETLHIPGSIAQGFFYIRILDEKNNVVSTQKLVVERW